MAKKCIGRGGHAAIGAAIGAGVGGALGWLTNRFIINLGGTPTAITAGFVTGALAGAGLGAIPKPTCRR